MDVDGHVNEYMEMMVELGQFLELFCSNIKTFVLESLTRMQVYSVTGTCNFSGNGYNRDSSEDGLQTDNLFSKGIKSCYSHPKKKVKVS